MLFILVFLYLGGCSLRDWRTGKIPNRFLLGWGMVFVLCSVWFGGWLAGIGTCLWGTVFTGLILFPLFYFRMMGAGDVKMMALLGGALGVYRGFEVIFCGLAAAAAWSVFYMVRKRMFLKRIRYFLNYMMFLPQSGEPVPYYDAKRDGKEAAFCLAPFLLCGYGLWLMVMR